MTTETIQTNEEQKQEVKLINLTKREIPASIEKLFIKSQEEINKVFVFINYTQDGKKELIGRELLEREDTIIVVLPTESTMSRETNTHKLLLSEEGPTLKIRSCGNHYHDFPDLEYLMLGEYPSYRSAGELNGYYLAFYSADCLIFNYDFLSENVGICDAKGIVSLVLKKYLKEYSRLNKTYKIRAERMVNDFIEFNKHIITRRKENIRGTIRTKQHEMMNHYSAIQRIENEIGELNTLTRSSMNRTNAVLSTPKDKLEKTFKNFLNKGVFYQLEYFNDRIEVYTDKIYIDYNGVRFYMGRFQIVINFSGTVKMFNLDNSRIFDREYHHPHISAGVPCLGNIKEMMPKLIHSGDYLTIITLCYDFLTSYNPNGPYVPIDRGWLPENVDWCSACQSVRNENGTCGCTRCAECGETVNNCQCPLCPRDGDLVANHSCAECESWDEETGCEY